MFGKPRKPGKQIAPAPVAQPRGHVIPGNGTVVVGVVFEPDAHSMRLANAMAISANTFSPMAAGVHSSGTPRGYTGDRGFGVNRFAGRTAPLQAFAGAAGPVAHPMNKRLGLGAGVAGQPGLPNTGNAADSLGPLGWMSFGQLNRTGT